MPEEEALEGQASAAIDCGSGELSRLTNILGSFGDMSQTLQNQKIAGFRLYFRMCLACGLSQACAYDSSVVFGRCRC